MKLIVFGNAETMSETKFYEKLVEYFRQRGDFVTIVPAETPWHGYSSLRFLPMR